jgi:hypothetical protein
VVHEQASRPVEQPEQERDDTSEEQEAHGILGLRAGPGRGVPRPLVDLLRHQTELGDVDAQPENEEGEPEDLALLVEDLRVVCPRLCALLRAGYRGREVSNSDGQTPRLTPCEAAQRKVGGEPDSAAMTHGREQRGEPC